MQQIASLPAPADPRWIKRYYATRAIVSGVWVGLAFLVGHRVPGLAIGLAAIYPAWDGIANGYDAAHNGGLRASPTQAINMGVSALVTISVIIAATRDFNAIVLVIGVWAILAGLLQLATAIRRWRGAGAQWPMILSGAQSAVAGRFFVHRALDPSLKLGIADIAPYAALGAIYFAISALILILKQARRARAAARSLSA